jgi:hypothetical protein
MTESTESGERHSAAPGLTGWTATILAGITAAFLAFLGNIIVTYLEGRNALQLKREEFQTSLILKAIKTGDAEVAAKNLSFFIQAGFLDDCSSRFLS